MRAYGTWQVREQFLVRECLCVCVESCDVALHSLLVTCVVNGLSDALGSSSPLLHGGGCQFAVLQFF
jgi:hypothetical protein